MKNSMNVSLLNLYEDPTLLQIKNLEGRCRVLAKNAGIDEFNHSVLRDSDFIDRVFSRVSANFSIMVIGQVSSGKSSFINSLFGRKLLVPSDRPTDGVVSVIMYADSKEAERATKILRNGEIQPFESLDKGLLFLRQQDTSQLEQLKCKEVWLYIHDPLLKKFRIINTPGLGDRLEQFEQTTLQYLQEEESDLIIWTFVPEMAANKEEIGRFSQSLRQRKGTILGVVTRILSGHEADLNYNPYKDSSCIEITEAIKKHLGDYLDDIILYDSLVARKLINEIKETPELESDNNMKFRLERCGYTAFQNYLQRHLGENYEKIEIAKLRSIILNCSEHAYELSKVSASATDAYKQKSDTIKEKLQAWEILKSNIIRPEKERFKEEIKNLAQERASELVAAIGNAAADCVNTNFNLLGTLFKSVFSYIKICNPVADELNKKIDKSIQEALIKQEYQKRLDDAAVRLISNLMDELKSELIKFDRKINTDNKSMISINIPIDSGSPGGQSQGVLGEAVAASLKGVVSAALKNISKTMESKAASQVAKEGTRQIVKKTTQQVVTKTAQQAAKTTGVSTAAKAASIVTLVLIPFDIHKLLKDFKKGKNEFANYVKERYESEKSIYASRIYDKVWSILEDKINTIVVDVDEKVNNQDEHWTQLALEASNCTDELLSLSTELKSIITM